MSMPQRPMVRTSNGGVVEAVIVFPSTSSGWGGGSGAVGASGFTVTPIASSSQAFVRTFAMPGARSTLRYPVPNINPSLASTTMPTTPFTVDVKLDRSSPIPLYFQISEPIASAIQDGTLAAGTRLEDELSMAKRLQVSRPTARQALQRLVDRGLLTRRRGVGTLVAPTRVHRPMELTSLHSDLVAAGLTVTTAVLDYDEHPATEEEAELLETQAETPIVRLVRLRSTDDEPIEIGRAHV